MVYFATLLSVALLSSVQVMAAPIPDSAINEPGVRSPDGVPVTDGSPAPTNTMMMGSNMYGGGDYNNNNNYGGNYNNGNNYMTTSTSTMMDKPSPTMMMDTTTEKMMDTTTKKMMDTTTTADMTSTTPPPSYSMPQYGSGYNNWNSGYNNCVQQCMSTYGGPATTYTAPPSTATNMDEGSNGGGSGNTHTVIVAPAPGVLRYYPFAVNASVGDTIHFQWNAGPHTVTRSSITLPCNKTSSPDVFASGVQNKSFTFDIQINDTNTINFYCGVPGHCEKGMFGFVNPPNSNGASTTVASMMPSLITTNNDLAMQTMYVMNKTMGTSAYTWGNDMDMSQVPAENHVAFVQNVLQTRLMFAANPGALEGNPENPNLTVPSDITQITGTTPANVGGAPTTTASETSTGTSSTATQSETASPGGAAKKGAAGLSRSVAGSSAVLGVAAMAAFMLL